MKTRLRNRTAYAIAAAAIFAAAPAAQGEDFYAGKTITIVCPYSPGGTYDRMSRLAAQYLPKYIPGEPEAIVENRPGGGGVIGIRAVYRAEPDGLSLVHFASTAVVRRLSGGIEDIDFRKLNWLGSPGGAHYVFFTRSERDERTIEALKNTDKPIRVAVSGPSSLLTQAAKFLQRAGKFNMRLVAGYKGYSPMALAVKQNEVDGVATAGAAVVVNAITWDMYRNDTIRLTLSMGGAPPHEKVAEDIAKLPKFVDAIEDQLDREAYVAFSGLLSASRPFATTPGVPPERVTILQKAMVGMMADPDFVKSATDQGFVLNPLDGAEAAEAILSVFKLPPNIQDRLNTLLK